MDDRKAGSAGKADELRAFVDQILFERGADALPEEVQAEMRTDLLSRAEDRINAAVLASLPPDKLEDFEKVIDGGEPDKIQAFAQQNIPNLAEVLGKELALVKTSYLSA